ncbi:MAG: MFS transporter [Fidelibacterota bacterium]|nr:MAG: MFS transporter [Candidatus Neomarinimicrobiota bacterium]
MRNVLTITAVGHLLNHSLTLIYPVIMIPLSEIYPEASLTTFGLLGTVHYFLYGLGAFPAGWLTDRLGARNILLIYFLGSAASVVILVLAPNLPYLAIGLALLGLFCALYHPAGLTLISHTSPSISHHLGLHGIAGSLGLTLGPLVGGAIAGWYGWKAPYILFGLLSVLAAGYVWRTLASDDSHRSPTHPQAQRPTQLRLLVFCYLIAIFMGLSHRGTLNFLPLYFSQVFTGALAPVMVGGFITALVLASGILGQTLGGIWGDRYSRRGILVIVVTMNIPFLLLIAYMHSYFLILAAVLWGVVNFAYQPISNALIADFSSARQRGTLFGILNGLTFGVGALAATLAGVIGDKWGTVNIFLAMALLLLPATIVGLFLRRSGVSKSIDSRRGAN